MRRRFDDSVRFAKTTARAEVWPRPRPFSQRCLNLSPETASAAETAARPAVTAAATRTALAGHRLGLHRDQAFTLRLLASELAGAAHRLRLFPGPLFRWFFVMAAKLHLAEYAL